MLHFLQQSSLKNQIFSICYALDQCFSTFFVAWPILSLGENDMDHEHYLVRFGYVIVASIYLVVKQTHIILKK